MPRPGAQEAGLDWRRGARSHLLEMDIQCMGVPRERAWEEKRAQD